MCICDDVKMGCHHRVFRVLRQGFEHEALCDTSQSSPRRPHKYQGRSFPSNEQEQPDVPRYSFEGLLLAQTKSGSMHAG